MAGKITRSFITGFAKVEGDKEIKYFPGMTKAQVEGFYKASCIKVEQTGEVLRRYACSEEDFLSIAKPL